MKNTLWCLVPILWMAAAWAPAQEASITLPLKEYQSLVDASARDSLTVIESVRLGGSLRSNALTLSIKGRFTGKPAKVQLLKRNPLMSLSDCSGDAVLSPDGGALALVPLKDPFHLSCTMDFREQERIELEFLSPALKISAQASDAEMILQDAGQGGATVVLTSLVALPGRKARDPIGAGRYRITILPNVTAFQYAFAFDNPNRSKVEYTLPLKNGEAIRTVTTSDAYREEARSLRFELLPGTNQVVINGTLPAARFVPPLPFDDQYLLVENHPMLNVGLRTGARRISPKDTQVAYTFRSVQGLLLTARDEVAWDIQKMQVFSAMGYSIPSLDYLVYLPAAGKPVVEARAGIDNQGGARMALEVAGKPAFLEINGEPQLLYRDGNDRLAIPVGLGTQGMTIQYESVKGLGLFSMAQNIRLLTFEAPATTVSVDLRHHNKWALLGAKFSRYVHLGITPRALIFRILLCLGLAAFLWKSGMGRLPSLWGAGLVFLLSFFSPLWLVPPVAYAAVVYFFRIMKGRRVSKELRVLARVAAAMGVFILVVVVATPNLMNRRAPEEKMLLYGSQSSGTPPSAPELNAPAKGPATQEAVQYEGLPARITLPPSDGRDLYFVESMLPANKPVILRAWFVSRILLKALGLAAFLLLGWWAWKLRGEFARIYRDAHDAYKASLPGEPAAG
jgi:hypothetical protein